MRHWGPVRRSAASHAEPTRQSRVGCGPDSVRPWRGFPGGRDRKWVAVKYIHLHVVYIYNASISIHQILYRHIDMCIYM